MPKGDRFESNAERQAVWRIRKELGYVVPKQEALAIIEVRKGNSYRQEMTPYTKEIERKVRDVMEDKKYRQSQQERNTAARAREDRVNAEILSRLDEEGLAFHNKQMAYAWELLISMDKENDCND